MKQLTTEKTTLGLRLNQGAFNLQSIEDAAKDLLKSPSAPWRDPEEIPFWRKYFVTEKATTKGLSEGQIRHYISTAALDRDHEIMTPKGADLKHYKKNPIVLWGHDYSQPENIVGKNIEAAQVYRLYKGGWIRAWSVGFIPLKGHKPEKKELEKLGLMGLFGDPPKPGEVFYIHDKWSLLEYSTVAVPSNPEALTLSVAKELKLSEKVLAELEIVLKEIPEVGDDKNKVILDLGDGKQKKEGKKEEAGTGEEEVETKGVIGYASHGTAEEGAEWDAGKEVGAADVKDLKVMCAWFDSEEPDVKSSYKLPHHRQGDKKAVWRGVSAAGGVMMGARGGLSGVPAGDYAGIKAHLGKHYKEFDKTPPWEKSAKQEEYNCECIECGYKLTTEEHCVDVECPKCGGEMRRVERPGAGRSADYEITKPSEKNHVCTINTGDYEKYRSAKRDHDGKPYTVRFGIKADGTSEENEYFYSIEDWTAAEAKAHCKDHDGTFEAATKPKQTATEDAIEILTEEIKSLKLAVEEKAGRELSAKNRTLIKNCVDAMAKATEALDALLAATEPEKDGQEAVENKGKQGLDLSALLHSEEIDLEGLAKEISKKVDISKLVTDIIKDKQ